jgi:hypothetical protein
MDMPANRSDPNSLANSFRTRPITNGAPPTTTTTINIQRHWANGARNA